MSYNSVKRPIVFYFPFPSVGGVSVLFLRLAKLLCDKRKIILMDLEDGYMAKNLPNNVEFVPYSKPEKIPNNSIVVIQSCPPWRIPYISNFPRNATLFFWNLHPDNLRPDFISNNSRINGIKWLFYLFTSIRKRKLNKLIELLLDNNAIRFMDRENFSSTSFYYDLRINKPSYLQILTEGNKTPKIHHNKINGNIINIAWLGRVEGFKTSILSHIIERLASVQSICIKLKIIGSGKDIDEIKMKCRNHNNIQFQFIEEISFHHITTTMSAIDILFAMGTSALEGARNKVPTILVDYSYKKINGLYQFKMIYEKQYYNLAEMINDSFNEDESSLEELLIDIVNNYADYADRSFLYWQNNFSPVIVIPKFIYAVDSSTFQFKDLFESNVQHPDIFTVLKHKIRDIIKPGTNDEGWQYS